MADFLLKALPNVVLGSHVLSRLGQVVPRWTGNVEKRFMLVSDPVLRNFGIEEKALSSLKESGAETIVFDATAQSTSDEVVDALSIARGARVRAVIGLGGITTASVGRAVAALYSEEGDVYEYIEGKQPASAPLPFIEVATTCRDHAMFMNKTPIADARNNQIIYMKIQDDVCKGVVIDPNVFKHMPQATKSAMLFQSAVLAFEGFVSTKASFFTDAILTKSLGLIFSALDAESGVELPIPADELAAQGGFLASLGATVSASGAATAFAAACDARYRSHSSIISTILFPHIVEDNGRASAKKTQAIARILKVGDEEDAGAAAARVLRGMIERQGLPSRLRDAGLSVEQLAAAAEDASKMEYMSYTPRAMTSDDLFDLAKRAY